MDKRPNILFIMTDEQKYDTFSCINSKIKTPHLDELIEQSVFFENAYCSNPSCIPSRAAIMTGKFPTACECPTYISKLPENEVTFMSKLQESGYYTAVVGKQHFDYSPISHGYDYEFIVDGHSPNMDKNEIKLFTAFLLEQGVDPETLYQGDLICGGHWNGELAHHIDSFVGDTGRNWLKNHIMESKEQERRPWFFTLSFPGPHQPYDGAGTKYENLYNLEDMTRNETVLEDLEKKPPHFMKLNPKAYIDKYDDETFKETLRSYYANMSLIDDKVGELLAMLKEKGEFDNTLIIYSSDHGDFMGDFGLVTKAQYLSEALMRVPLFVKPPVKDFKGVKIENYVTNINIASTCLIAAESPCKITENMENNPYQQYWAEENSEGSDYLYMEAHNIKGVIFNKIKVIYYVDRSYGELYDLSVDPLERNNLWKSDEYLLAKNKGMGYIIDKLFQLSPKSSMKWNTHAPEI